ncbi:hypothetical protein Tco_0586449 [Tanacetum coccineum]
MSNTNNNLQTQTSNALHNAIMEAGGKDRHPMLAPDKMETKDAVSSCSVTKDADNRPPLLEKDMYYYWKSRMELYMMNRQHGRMILESVENGPLIWPSIEENGVTRPKKYSELSATEAIQADCDIKATNIILQGLPPEVYALFLPIFGVEV